MPSRGTLIIVAHISPFIKAAIILAFSSANSFWMVSSLSSPEIICRMSLENSRTPSPSFPETSLARRKAPIPFCRPRSWFQAWSFPLLKLLRPPIGYCVSCACIGGRVTVWISFSCEERRGYFLKSNCNSSELSSAAKGPLKPAAEAVPSLGVVLSAVDVGSSVSVVVDVGSTGGWVVLWMVEHLIEQLEQQ